MSDQKASKSFVASAIGVIVGICVFFGLMFVVACGGCIFIASQVPDAMKKEMKKIEAENKRRQSETPHETKTIERSPAPTASSDIITAAEFSKIQTGMSQSQVVEIVGDNGEEVSRSDIAGINTVMIMWKNPNFSNANAMFQNGKLVQKSQFGLK